MKTDGEEGWGARSSGTPAELQIGGSARVELGAGDKLLKHKTSSSQLYGWSSPSYVAVCPTFKGIAVEDWSGAVSGDPDSLANVSWHTIA